MRVVICGGGVVGTALAYALSQRGAVVSLIERWRVGGAASGKSGGFLARDWCDSTPVAPLARRSFDLHEAWAEAIGNTYGYAKVDTFGATMRSNGQAANAHMTIDGTKARPEWMNEKAAQRQQLGNTSTTAILDPAEFTNALMTAAISHRASLHIGAVAGLERRGNKVAGVRLGDGEVVPADAVVLALGPWSLLAAQWTSIPPIYGLKGHSIIFRPAQPLPVEALFAEIETADGEVHTPEIVSRADGTVYVCGLPGTGALPVDPAAVATETGGPEQLREIALSLVPALADAEIIKQQACFRPVTSDGMPLIGPVDGYPGLFLATGHSVWGMLNAPGTAEALAGLILDGVSGGVDLAAFQPARLAALDPGEVQVQAN